MKIEFENHMGVMDMKTNVVIFYGVTFSGILEAITLLKGISPKNTYVPWQHRRHKGLLDKEDGSVYIKDRWFPDESFAKEIIKAGYK